jgi:uncharacterized protein (DUF433 family)
MESVDRQAELTLLRRQKPFVPFRVTTTDGRFFEVREPQFCFNDRKLLIVKKTAGTWDVPFAEIESIATIKEPSLAERFLYRITRDPAKRDGRPCIRGTKTSVVDVLNLLAEGKSHRQVLAELPDLEEEDIQASLVCAAEELRH